jgi:hypothetical protein
MWSVSPPKFEVNCPSGGEQRTERVPVAGRCGGEQRLSGRGASAVSASSGSGSGAGTGAGAGAGAGAGTGAGAGSGADPEVVSLQAAMATTIAKTAVSRASGGSPRWVIAAPVVVGPPGRREDAPGHLLSNVRPRRNDASAGHPPLVQGPSGGGPLRVRSTGRASRSASDDAEGDHRVGDADEAADVRTCDVVTRDVRTRPPSRSRPRGCRP